VLALRRYGFGHAIAIEPDPENVGFLRQNIARNGVESSVDVVNAAAAAEPGEGTFKLGRETTGGRRRAGAGSMLGPKHRPAEEIAMRVVTVDGVLGELGIAPSDVGLLWLDVQGFEGHVAAGAEQVLGAARPFVFAFRARKLARSGQLERLLELVASSYAHVLDLRDPDAGPLPAGELARFTDGRGTTDILAFGRPR
jgi:FkbM family methyltransferase